MTETLKPEDFEILEGGITPVSSMQILHMFDFHPNKCKIEVDDFDNLTITQEGVSELGFGPEFWRRIK